MTTEAPTKPDKRSQEKPKAKKRPTSPKPKPEAAGSATPDTPGMFDHEITGPEAKDMEAALDDKARLAGNAEFQEQKKQEASAKNVVKAWKKTNQDKIGKGTRVRIGRWALVGGKPRPYGGFRIPKGSNNTIGEITPLN